MSNDPELFSEHIAEFSAGWLDRDATEQLKDLIKAVKVAGKKGSLTLKLDVIPREAKDGDIVIIRPTVTTKEPKITVDPEVFRTYDNGELEIIPRADGDGDGLGDDIADTPPSKVTQIRKR